MLDVYLLSFNVSKFELKQEDAEELRGLVNELEQAAVVVGQGIYILRREQDAPLLLRSRQCLRRLRKTFAFATVHIAAGEACLPVEFHLDPDQRAKLLSWGVNEEEFQA